MTGKTKMKTFTKQVMNRFSVLSLALIVSISAMMACTSSEKAVNNSSSSGTAQSGLAANDKSTTENKSVENKSVETEQAEKVKVYDGRNNLTNSKKASDAETKLLESEVSANKEAIKKIGSEGYSYDGEPCRDESIGVGKDFVEGSFTKPNSKQKAFAYSLCRGDGPTGPTPYFIGGILIVENGKLVANYVYSGESDYGIGSLPDINQNGLSEIILTSSFSNMGVSNNTIAIMETKADGLTALGSTIVYSEDVPEKMLADKTDEKLYSAAYDISVQTGKTPVFYRETYIQKTENGKSELKEKAKTFSLENPGNGKTDEGFKKL